MVVISWILSFDEALNGEKKTGSWNYERPREEFRIFENFQQTHFKISDCQRTGPEAEEGKESNER